MKREIVVDCSVSASWILPDEKTPKSERILKDALSGKICLVEPVSWKYESINLLRSAIIRKRLTEQMAKKALYLLTEVPIEFIDPHTQSDFEILNSSLQHGLSSYDATYLNLAEIRGIDLVSAGKELLALKSKFSWIKSVMEYR